MKGFGGVPITIEDSKRTIKEQQAAGGKLDEEEEAGEAAAGPVSKKPKGRGGEGGLLKAGIMRVIGKSLLAFNGVRTRGI